jgi:hypothetical protein
MIRYYCDRCDADITGQKKYRFETSDIRFETLNDLYGGLRETTRIELCAHCVDMLKLWMERGQGDVADYRD